MRGTFLPAVVSWIPGPGFRAAGKRVHPTGAHPRCSDKAAPRTQVALVRRFMDAYNSGGSLCHQLIMGAGKTTVVSPLLALLLGDGRTCITQVAVWPPASLGCLKSCLQRSHGAHGPAAGGPSSAARVLARRDAPEILIRLHQVWGLCLPRWHAALQQISSLRGVW